ncbi:MAG: DMT family transporter [Ktedonobacterales bacterium]
MRTREYGVLFALALVWGASFYFIKIAVGPDGMSPATVVFGRLAFSVLTLGVVALARPSFVAGWRHFWRLGLIVGLVNNALPYMLITWGETRIASGIASILNATTPLFTVILANWWTGSGYEQLTPRRALGVVCGFIGVGVLVGPDALQLTGNTGLSYALGEGAVLLAGLSYAFGTLFSRRYAGASQLVPSLTSQVAALVMVTPVALLWSPPTHVPSLKAIGAVAVLGIAGTALAYLLYFWLIAHVGATRTAIVTYLLPFTALLWGALLLHEHISPSAIAGLLLVLLGTLITNGTLNRLLRRSSAATTTQPAVETDPERGVSADASESPPPVATRN